MSYPSSQTLMTQLILDPMIPLAVRAEALRDPSFRPALSTLLRLIKDEATPVKLKSCAVIRYSQQMQLKELKRYAKRSARSQAA